jgi:2-phosphosulfolactate phosphatase
LASLNTTNDPLNLLNLSYLQNNQPNHNGREVQKGTLEVCFSPSLAGLYKLEEATVVVIDVFRATSAMCTAFANGVDKIIPVATLEEAEAYKQKGYIVAAERNGKVVDGFKIGNSPFSYMDASLKGKTIVMTTTNGTQAIDKAKNAKKILIASFLNLNSVVNYLKKEKGSVVILCAGWQFKYNLEDTLLAGAITHYLKELYTNTCDAAIASSQLYEQHCNNKEALLSKSSHAKRLASLGIEKDISFCLQTNYYNVLPIVDNKGAIVAKIKDTESLKKIIDIDK